MASGGLKALSVEAIARTLSVTKGSFYHHFESRDALLDAILERWRAQATETLIQAAEIQPSPAQQLRSLMDIIFTYATDQEPLEVVIRSIASTDAKVAAYVTAVDQRRLDYVRALFEAIGLDAQQADLRTRTLYRLVIGDALWRSAGEPAYNAHERAQVVEMFLKGGA